MSIRAVVRSVLGKVGLLKTLYRFSMRMRLKTIPIDQVHRPRTPFSDMPGFSGSTVDCFPSARFYRLYLTDPVEAHKKFCEWLRKCLIEMHAWKLPKSEGGWANGPLVNSVIQAHRDRGVELKDFKQCEPEILNSVIEEKVSYYFGVLESIKKNGFVFSVESPMSCKRSGEIYILVNGHHRISALWALGYKEVDVVMVP